MKNKTYFFRYFLGGLLSIVLLVALDQWTKFLALTHLKNQEDIILIPGVFQLHYLENRGAAFSLFQNRIWMLVLLTVIFLSILFWVYFRIPRTRHYFPLHLTAIFLAAGALGNFVDRVRMRYVVDFFYFSLINFPVFNVADIFVVASFILLIICVFFFYSDEDFSFLCITGKR